MVGQNNASGWRACLIPHGLIYSALALICIVLFVLATVFGVLWSHSNYTGSVFSVEKGIIGSPVPLPDDGRYVQWTFLHLNDVYEILPLDQRRKGGLARVAHMRQLLKKENVHTYTSMGGDFLSPSALSTAKLNGSTLNGRQMVAALNTLELDWAAFGNHEFDLNENDLLARMNESTFTWIASNIVRRNTSQLFGSSITHKILTVDGVRILLIGLTVDTNIPAYIDIVTRSSLIAHAEQFLRQFPNGSYDVLVALTHLDLETDIDLARSIPQIDMILGGHEHENYYYLRGNDFTPIYKADANAFTVYILRCAFNVNTRRLRMHDTLARVTPEVPDEPKTAAVVNYWFQVGIDGFRLTGFEPMEVVSCLPAGVELDGRSDTVRNMPTRLTDLIAESMLKATAASETTIAVFNTGAIRIDDVIRETVTQYDILRSLPYPNKLVSLSVPSRLLADVMREGMKARGTGMYLAYTGIESVDKGLTWRVNGTDLATSDGYYRVVTIEFARGSTLLKSSNVTILAESNATQTKVLIDFLRTKYPPC